MTIERLTTVINVFRAPPDRLAQIRAEGRLVEIMRPSKWGNRFSHLPSSTAAVRVATRDEAIRRFEEWLIQQPHLIRELPELKGKVLGCCCAPASCHGGVLARYANTFPRVLTTDPMGVGVELVFDRQTGELLGGGMVVPRSKLIE